MRVIESIIRINEESREVVLGRHLAAVTALDTRRASVVGELGTCPLGRTQGLMQKLWNITVEELERDLNGLKVARELVLLKGRFRLSLPPAYI